MNRSLRDSEKGRKHSKSEDEDEEEDFDPDLYYYFQVKQGGVSWIDSYGNITPKELNNDSFQGADMGYIDFLAGLNSDPPQVEGNVFIDEDSETEGDTVVHESTVGKAGYGKVIDGLSYFQEKELTSELVEAHGLPILRIVKHAFFILLSAVSLYNIILTADTAKIVALTVLASVSMILYSRVK